MHLETYFLTNAILILGWGVYISYTAAAAAAAKLFIYNRTTAMGIMLAGGSLGVITYPFLFQYLLRQYTLRGVMLILAGLYLNFFAVASLVLIAETHFKMPDIVDIKTNIEIDVEFDEEKACENEDCTGSNGDTKDKLQDENFATYEKYLNTPVDLKEKYEPKIETVDKVNVLTPNTCPCFSRLWHLCKPFLSIKFVSFILFHMTSMFGLYGYLMYVPPYLVEAGLTKTEIASLLSIDGAFDLIGRITIGFLASHPKVNMYMLISVNSAISGCFDLILPMMLSGTAVYPVMAANMAVLGLFVGGTLGLHGQLIVDAVGTERAGTGYGLSTTSFGIATSLTAVIYGMKN